MADVRENCRRVLEKLHQAARRSGRNPQSVRLIAVTKKVSIEHIRRAAECGIADIGENRLQEALPKREELQDIPLTWHFIGHLQTNKAKRAAENFDWIQSVDRAELAEKLNQAMGTTGQTPRPPMPVMIEVKLHEEPNKSGVAEAGLSGLVERFHQYDRLQLRGLMAIPPFSDNAEDSRPYFRKLRQLAQQHGLTDLSMGMSHDFEVAIEEGATMVRIGTALFGQRQ